MTNYKTITIIGPTGIGKTQLSIALAKKLPIELISVDSMLFYKGLTIGTAKPSSQEMQSVKHHMIDILNPTDNYSVANYIKAIQPIIEDIRSRNKTPIIIGGTMMYVWTMQNGLHQAPASNITVRNQITLQAQQLGWQKMWQKLAHLDPDAASKIQPNDKQRISRALERLASNHDEDIPKQSITQIPLEVISLWPNNRELLYENLNNRALIMLKQGLLQEVIDLYSDFPELNKNHKLMSAVGYKQVSQYLNQELSYDEMTAKIQQANRNLAKRQITWMKKIQSHSIEVQLDQDNHGLTGAYPALIDLINKIVN